MKHYRVKVCSLYYLNTDYFASLPTNSRFWSSQGELRYLRWLETLFENCEKNGFEHDIVDYYSILKGKEYHSGTQK